MHTYTRTRMHKYTRKHIRILWSLVTLGGSYCSVSNADISCPLTHIRAAVTVQDTKSIAINYKMAGAVLGRKDRDL